MFLKKKKNRSGTTSVVVAEKRKGVYRELKTVGVSSDETKIRYSWSRVSNGLKKKKNAVIHGLTCTEKSVGDVRLS